MNPQTKQALQAEHDRLRAALGEVLTVCARERHDPAEWAQALGEVAYIARTALTPATDVYHVSLGGKDEH